MSETQSPIEFSPTRLEIGKAMLKAQSEIGPLVKTESNPMFGSKYADLASVIEATRKPLLTAGLVLIQGASTKEATVDVETMLLHAESGEWVRTVLSLTPLEAKLSKDSGERSVTPQTVGSAITYARRYGLQALCGIAPEDDDANAASSPIKGRGPQPNPFTQPTPSSKTPETWGQQQLQARLEYAEMNEAKEDDKDTRPWYNAGDKGIGAGPRKFWTRDASIGQELLAAKGLEVVLTVIPGTKNRNAYKVLDVKVPDELPGLEGTDDIP